MMVIKMIMMLKKMEEMIRKLMMKVNPSMSYVTGVQVSLNLVLITTQ